MAYKRKREQGRSKWLAPALAAGFGAGASSLGYGAFAPAASAFGGYLGQKIKDITGYGAYSLNKNSILTGDVPGVSNASNVSGLCISHKEYLGDVVTGGANAFSIQSFALNPGASQTWEWLAQIACNYEEWVPEGIIFYYKSTSGDALSSTNTALGIVIMATNYNVYNPPFSSKAEMESYEFCSSGSPAGDLMHPIECDPQQGALSTFYIRPGGNVNTTNDMRFSDLGTFYLATSGFQAANVTIGELWVTYQISLLKPKLYASLGNFNDYFKMYNQLNCYNSAPLGTLTGAILDPVNTMPLVNQPGTTSPLGASTIGNPNSSGLILTQGTGFVLIYWPIYAYPTVYRVSFQWTTPSYTNTTATILHNAGNYGSTIPSTIRSFVSPLAGGTTFMLQVTMVILVPGQALAPSLANGISIQPSTKLSQNLPTVASGSSVALEIIQQPSYDVQNP